MISKIIFNKYKNNESVKAIVKKNSYEDFMDIASNEKKNQLLNIIDTIKDVKKIGYAPTKKNVEIAKEAQNIKNVTITKRGKTETISTKQYATLYKKKYGAKKAKATTAEEKKKAIQKDLFKLQKGTYKDKKLNIVDYEGKILNILNISISFVARIEISEGIQVRPFRYNYVGNNNMEMINDKTEDFLEYTLTKEWGLMIYQYSILNIQYTNFVSNINGRIFIEDRENAQLRDENPISLINMFGKNYDINKSNNNCVINALKISNGKKEELKKLLEEKDYITPRELYEFCKKNNLSIRIYDIEGKIILKNSCKDVSYINILAYNEHAYILKNKFLKCLKKNDKLEKIFLNKEELGYKFDKLIRNKIQPTDIKFNEKNEIVSFVDDDKMYIGNEKYKACEYLLGKLGIEDEIQTTINERNMMNNILRLFDIKKKSYFPFTFTKSPFSYISENIDKTKKMKSIDMNKAYSYCLRDLPYLVSCDYKFDKVIERPSEIIEHYLYNIRIDGSSIFFPTSGIYWGKILLLAKENDIEFEIIEGIETKKHDNDHKKMIETLYKLNDEELQKLYGNKNMIKNMVNSYIGNMINRNISFKKDTILKSYIPEKEIKYSNDVKNLYINNSHYAFSSEEKETDKTPLNDSYPILIQIKDFCNIRMFEKMKELELKDEDIVGVFTDNIVYYDNGQQFIPCELWKEDKVNFDKFPKNMHDNESINNLFSFKEPNFKKNDNKNVLVDGNAGMGKTYYILNKLIPNLDNYIVLSPKHTAITKYRKENKNCDTIQKYTVNNKIPTEENIIIDEYGMMDNNGWKLALKCQAKGKRVFMFGDNTQLLNVDSDKPVTKLFMKCFFNDIIECKANYRNNFDYKFYDKLRYEETSNDIIDKLLNKYCNDKKPEIYIGIRNDTVEKKNLEILEKNGKYDSETKKFKNLVGVPVICKSNNYVEYELYNNFPAVISDEDEKHITIEFEEQEITIKRRVFFNNFVFGYAVNLYNFQGDESNKIKFLEEDKKYILMNRRALYTLISRYQEELKDKQKEFNKTQEYKIKITDYDDILCD